MWQHTQELEKYDVNIDYGPTCKGMCLDIDKIEKVQSRLRILSEIS